MADAKIDLNYKKTLTAVTDDASATIARLLVDPATGRLKVSATISGGGQLTGSGTVEYIAKWSGGSALTISSILDSGGSISVGSARLYPVNLTALRTFTFPDASGTIALISDLFKESFVVGSSGNQFNISSSGTTNTFNLPTASSSGTGQLTATDWTTFNNKATSNGTVYLTGSGTVNQVAYFSGGSALSSSGSFYWNNTNGFLGINNNTPGALLDIFGSSGTLLSIRRNAGGTLFVVDSVGRISVGSISSVLEILPNGNVGIGTTTPNVFKLQVNGNVGPDTTTNNLGSVGTPWSSVFAGSLSATSGGTLQGTFLAGTGLTLPAFTVRGIVTPANTNDLGSSGSAFGTIFTTNLSVASNAYFTSENSVGSTSSATTINWAANGNKQYIGVNQTATLSFGTPFGPCNLILRTSQENKTGGVITWPSNVRWSGGSALSTGSNQIDVAAFYFDNQFYWGQLATNFVK